MIYRTSSSTITKKLGALLGKETVKTGTKGPVIIALHGELGSGKTTFAQGFAKGVGVTRTLTSPTFLLIRGYPLRQRTFQKLFHVDAYRIKGPKELAVLGIKKTLSDPTHIVLIEWAEKIKQLLPRYTIHITFEHGRKEDERTIRI